MTTLRTIRIFGASDDLMEVEELDEEGQPKARSLNSANSLTDEGYLSSDIGYVVVTSLVDKSSSEEDTSKESELEVYDVFAVEYTSERPDGLWKIRHEVKSNALQSVTLEEPAPESDDYTEIAIITGNIIKVSFEEQWPPNLESVQNELEDITMRDFLSSLHPDELITVVEMWTRNKYYRKFVSPS